MTERETNPDATNAPEAGDTDQRQALTDDLANPGQLDSATGGYAGEGDEPGESDGGSVEDRGPGGDIDTSSIA
jgi:hypothetical protein